jgi:hypothetical protein
VQKDRSVPSISRALQHQGLLFDAAREFCYLYFMLIASAPVLHRIFSNAQSALLLGSLLLALPSRTARD